MEVLVQRRVIVETIINYHDCLNGFKGWIKIVDNRKLWKQTKKKEGKREGDAEWKTIEKRFGLARI